MPQLDLIYPFTLFTHILIVGGRSHCHRGLAHCLHCLCVRCPGGVHRHPSQNEDEETHWDKEEEGQLRHHRPCVLCLLPNPVHNL